MYALSNVTFHGVEANTPSDGVKTVRFSRRGVGRVWTIYCRLIEPDEVFW